MQLPAAAAAQSTAAAAEIVLAVLGIGVIATLTWLVVVMFRGATGRI